MRDRAGRTSAAALDRFNIFTVPDPWTFGFEALRVAG
jgi:hypothetical protein